MSSKTSIPESSASPAASNRVREKVAAESSQSAGDVMSGAPVLDEQRPFLDDLQAAGKAAPLPEDLADARYQVGVQLGRMESLAMVGLDALPALLGTSDELPWDVNLFAKASEGLGGDVASAIGGCFTGAGPAGAVVGRSVSLGVELGLDALAAQAREDTSSQGDPTSSPHVVESFVRKAKVAVVDAFALARSGVADVQDVEAMCSFVAATTGADSQACADGITRAGVKLWVRYAAAATSSSAKRDGTDDLKLGFEHILGIRFTLDGGRIQVVDARIPGLPEAARTELAGSDLTGMPLCLQGVGRQASGIVVDVSSVGDFDDRSESYARTHLERLADRRGTDPEEALGWIVERVRGRSVADLGVAIEGMESPTSSLFGVVVGAL